MRPVITSQQSRAIDEECISKLGIASYDLMETASTNAVACLHGILGDHHGLRIVVGCGTGNNGGDGFAMARLLSARHRVTVLHATPVDKMSAETRRNYELARACTRLAPWEDGAAWLQETYDVVIDALIGVGGRGELHDAMRTFCTALDGLTTGMKIAIDVPTGLDANTGGVGPVGRTVFHADHTITMVAPKPGFYRNDGPSCTGTVRTVPIGAPDDVVARHTNTFILEPSDIRSWLPERRRQTSKFDYGRVLVVGGSRDMRGAPALTAHAALVAGAGLLDCASPALHPLLPREVMTCELPATAGGTMAAAALDVLQRKADRATVVAIGPGLGDDAETLDTVMAFLDGLDPAIPVVIDADALRVVPLLRRDLRNVVCTPHLGEFARMLGVERVTLADTAVERSRSEAARLGCVLHVKDVPSVTTDGTTSYLTVNGNAGMATAGSGDVLTGIMAGLLAQGLEPLRAAALGAYLHASAGDRYAAARPMETLVASDLLDMLDQVLMP
jgi:NAD(P)H-hydrate epimerase